MSLNSANEAAGVKLEHNASGDCFFAHLPNNPDKPEFLFQDGNWHVFSPVQIVSFVA
jgi:hypothetical protein